MAESSETDYLKPFIESTTAAAARFRRVLIVMITASILAFGAFWNSLGMTWFNSRITAARRGEALLTLEHINDRLKKIENELIAIQQKREKNPIEEQEQQKPEEKPTQKLEERKQELISDKASLLSDANKILKNRFGKDEEITNVGQLECEMENETYSSTRGWIKQRMMPDKDQAARYALRLEEARTRDILLIHIPFVGVVFDVNSLGLWGGTTFIVLLLIFRFSLWREYNNLRLTFQEAKPEHRRFCYMSLAMEQVLTVPPALPPSQPDLKPRGGVVQALYFPPLIIQALIIINDTFFTYDIGGIFNTRLTLISTGVSLVFLGVIVVLTIKCLHLSSAINKEWEAAAENARADLLEKWHIEQRAVQTRAQRLI